MPCTLHDFSQKPLHASACGRVAVLMGGWSQERTISLHSGQAVLTALQKDGIDAYGYDVTRASLPAFIKQEKHAQPDRVVNMLHGSGGEDGIVQGLLESCGIPYTGSGITASALTMHKGHCKAICCAHGIETPAFAVVQSVAAAEQALHTIGLPAAIKPVASGSSLGVSRIDHISALADAFSVAKEADDADNGILIERWIPGIELTVAVLCGTALPVIALGTPDSTFYDYAAKYRSKKTQYLCPAPIDVQTTTAVQAMAERVFAVCGLRTWGRIDCIYGQDGTLYCLEVNTVPGMTVNSLVPKAAAAAGIDFATLVRIIVSSALPAV